MASITIRNLDDEVGTCLWVRTSANGRSMDEGARLILAEAADRELTPQDGLGTVIEGNRVRTLVRYIDRINRL